MSRTALELYHARMQRVLDHIDRHLDEDLSLTALSAVAAFSPHHFHRQFGAVFGISLHRYVQLARMKQASYRLAFRSQHSVTQVALDAGYDAPDAFARAFRQRFGQSPSAFRKSPDWEPWSLALGPFKQARTRLMTEQFSLDEIRIVDFPETRVARMTHRGDPARIGDSIQRFIAWRKSAGLPPSRSATFNVFPVDPRKTAPDDFRLEFCAATDAPIAANDFGVEADIIPAGRCAALRVTGWVDDLEPAALFLYRNWLPESGEEPRDFPLFCQRLNLYPDVPEYESAVDLFLPLR